MKPAVRRPVVRRAASAGTAALKARVADAEAKKPKNRVWAGALDICLVAGGVIPDEDVPVLRDMGVAEVILQDTPPDTIVARIRDLVAARPTG